MTKLCCFCQDNSHLSVFKRHAEAAESERVHRENEWAPSSPDLNSLDYYVWVTMLAKYHKLQLKFKTADEFNFKVAI